MNRSRGERHGVAAVEFAIVAPLLFLFVFACVDFGRIFAARNTVCNAARSGALQGATKQFTEYSRNVWEQNVQDAIFNELAAEADIDPGEVAVTIDVSEGVNDSSTITISVEYQFRTIVSWPGLPSETDIRHQVAFTQFR